MDIDPRSLYLGCLIGGLLVGWLVIIAIVIAAPMLSSRISRILEERDNQS